MNGKILNSAFIKDYRDIHSRSELEELPTGDELTITTERVRGS